MAVTVKKLNADARRAAEALAARFPELGLTEAGVAAVRDAARFVAFAGNALAACRDRLKADGKDISEAGVKFVLRECAAHLGLLRPEADK